jgi:hypothetical protein
MYVTKRALSRTNASDLRLPENHFERGDEPPALAAAVTALRAAGISAHPHHHHRPVTARHGIHAIFTRYIH